MRRARRRYGRAQRSVGAIKDKTQIMLAAVQPGGAVTYLHYEPTLKRWERMGLVFKEYDYQDGTWSKYRATDKGRDAFARGRLP